MTLDATWGGRDAESYITLADADVWIRKNVLTFDAWELANEAQRESALLEATRNIDALNWHGGRIFYTQMREFPRIPPGTEYGVGPGSQSSPDEYFINSLTIDEYRRKQYERVRQACCLQALAVLRMEGEDADREDQFRGNTSVSRGARYSTSKGFGGTHQILHPKAYDLLRYYKGAPRVVRGDIGGSGYGR